MILDTCTGYISLQVFEIIKSVLLILSIVIPLLAIISLMVRFFKYVVGNEDSTKELVSMFIQKVMIAAFGFMLAFFAVKTVFSDKNIKTLESKGFIQSPSCDALSKISMRGVSKANNIVELTVRGSLDYSYFKYDGKKYTSNTFEVTANKNNIYKVTFYDSNDQKIVEKEYEFKYVAPPEPKKPSTEEGNNSSTGSTSYYPRSRTIAYEVPNYSNVKNVSDFDPELVRKAIADLAYEVGKYNREDFIYSGYVGPDSAHAVYMGHNSESYAGTRFSGVRVYGTTGWQIYDGNGNPGRTDWKGKRFIFDCVGYVNFIVHTSTKLGSASYTNFFNRSTYGFKGSSSLSPGDLIAYSGHYLIYIGNINGKDTIGDIYNSSYPNNWTVRTANLDRSKIVNISHFSNMVNGLNYNKVVSEPTLWAKLDTVKPVIDSISLNGNSITVSAHDQTDSKFVDTSGNGINGYTVTSSLEEPVVWTNLSYDSSINTVKQTTFTIDNYGSAKYVWVRDRGGNVSYKAIN